jgi:hypothetical protein
MPDESLFARIKTAILKLACGDCCQMEDLSP